MAKIVQLDHGPVVGDLYDPRSICVILKRVIDMKKIISLLAISLFSVSAQAGRPLSVDDANVNDQGVAHVETFWSRAADGSRTLTIAPTYSPLPGLDLIVADARTLSGGAHSQTLQAKMQVTSPKDNSCHFAWVLGATQWQKGEGQKSFVSANSTCDMGVGALHASMVSSRDGQGRDTPSLGVAWEQSFGAWTGHIESVAQRASKPMVGIGARTDVMPGFQVDGTLGRLGGKAMFSLGTKITF
jgi:hypothetical protein